MEGKVGIHCRKLQYWMEMHSIITLMFSINYRLPSRIGKHSFNYPKLSFHMQSRDVQAFV